MCEPVSLLNRKTILNQSMCPEQCEVLLGLIHISILDLESELEQPSHHRLALRCVHFLWKNWEPIYLKG